MTYKINKMVYCLEEAQRLEWLIADDMLLSTGQDNTKLLSALNEQLGIKLSEMITNKIEE